MKVKDKIVKKKKTNDEVQNSTRKEMPAFLGVEWDPQEALMNQGESLMHLCLFKWFHERTISNRRH